MVHIRGKRLYAVLRSKGAEKHFFRIFADAGSAEYHPYCGMYAVLISVLRVYEGILFGIVKDSYGSFLCGAVSKRIDVLVRVTEFAENLGENIQCIQIYAVQRSDFFSDRDTSR